MSAPQLLSAGAAVRLRALQAARPAPQTWADCYRSIRKAGLATDSPAGASNSKAAILEFQRERGGPLARSARAERCKPSPRRARALWALPVYAVRWLMATAPGSRALREVWEIYRREETRPQAWGAPRTGIDRGELEAAAVGQSCQRPGCAGRFVRRGGRQRFCRSARCDAMRKKGARQ